MCGPPIRTDIVEVYVFRRQRGESRGAAFLQLRRAETDKDLPGTWQPVMGHIEQGETAARTALRELAEETGYGPGRGMVGFWQLESPDTYFLHSHGCIVMSPCFAVEVEADLEPRLDPTHDAHRWVERARADRAFFWPGQRRAVGEVMRDILEPGSQSERVLRIAWQQGAEGS